MRDIAAVDIFH